MHKGSDYVRAVWFTACDVKTRKPTKPALIEKRNVREGQTVKQAKMMAGRVAKRYGWEYRDPMPGSGYIKLYTPDGSLIGQVTTGFYLAL